MESEAHIGFSGRFRGSFIACLAGLWLFLVPGGFWMLQQEAFTPVPEQAVSRLFPSPSTVPLDPDRPTLVFFAHPHCPCTRASFHELESILAGTRSKISAVIVFTVPETVESGWEQGDLWRRAVSVPELGLVCDSGGREARRFGVSGSGHVLLYESSGRLLFSGGITPARGHEGKNRGSESIVRILLHGHSPDGRTPVFGCSLL